MKLKYVLTLLMTLPFFVAMAQPPGKAKMSKEEIEAQKIAFLTKEMALTSEEAQVFWPVYNAFEDKQKALKKEHRTNRKKLKDGANLNDAELEQLMDSEIELRTREAALIAEYHEKFKAVLPIQKLARLYHAEDKFKRHLLKQMKGGHDGPPPPPDHD